MHRHFVYKKARYYAKGQVLLTSQGASRVASDSRRADQRRVLLPQFRFWIRRVGFDPNKKRDLSKLKRTLFTTALAFLGVAQKLTVALHFLFVRRCCGGNLGPQGFKAVRRNAALKQHKRSCVRRFELGVRHCFYLCTGLCAPAVVFNDVANNRPYSDRAGGTLQNPQYGSCVVPLRWSAKIFKAAAMMRAKIHYVCI